MESRRIQTINNTITQVPHKNALMHEQPKQSAEQPSSALSSKQNANNTKQYHDTVGGIQNQVPNVQNKKLNQQDQKHNKAPNPVKQDNQLNQLHNVIIQSDDAKKNKDGQRQQNLSQSKQAANGSICTLKQQESSQKRTYFSQVTQSNLKLYFKYVCEHQANALKNATFQAAKNTYKSINMTAWMFFCKIVGITQHAKLIKQSKGVKWLCAAYKKNQNFVKRMDCDNFLSAVREIIEQMAEKWEGLIQQKNTSQLNGKTGPTKQQNLAKMIELLGLDNKEKTRQRLKQIGVMCSQKVYVMPTKTRKTQRKQRQNNSVEQSHPESAQRKSFKQKQNTSSSLPPLKKKLPKIYLSHEQRRQSKLMHSLAVSNLSKLSPTQDTKAFLQNFSGYDDRYLRQYFKKQDTVQSGVLSKLEAIDKANQKSRKKPIR